MQAPAPICGYAPGRIDVFWCAADNTSVMQSWFDGLDWQTRTIATSNQPFAPAPAVYADKPGKMDVGWTDADGNILYMQRQRDRWDGPTLINPAFMATSDGSDPPSDFHPGSALIACPSAINRRWGNTEFNTEFLVCGIKPRMLNLAFDGSRWAVADYHVAERTPFAPVQIQASIYTPTPRPHVFWVGQDHMLRVNYVEADPNTVRSTYLQVPHHGTYQNVGPVTSQPAVIAGLAPGRVDVFWTSDNKIMHTFWDGTDWFFPSVLGNSLDVHFDFILIPVCGLAPGRLDLFWRQTQGSIMDTCFDGTRWTTTPVAHQRGEYGVPFPPPAAVYEPSRNRIHLFWLDQGGNLINTSCDGTSWRPPAQINPPPLWATPAWRGAALPAPAALYGYDQGRMDVFWGGADQTLKQAYGDGTTWNALRINPGPVTSAAVTRPMPYETPQQSYLFWENTDGAVISVMGSIGLNAGDLTANPLIESGCVMSPIASCVFLSDAFIYWINSDNQLCETRRWGATGNVRPPALFSARFAPAVLTLPEGNLYGLELFVCDTELMLWHVAWTNANVPYYAARALHIGPLAFAPVAVTPGAAPQPNKLASNLGGDKFVFWCAKDDMSLRQSWRPAGAIDWQTTTIDPGPMTSAPAQLLLPNGEFHLFWAGQGGTLKHKWAFGSAMRTASWQTEVISNGPMGSAPCAVHNPEQQKIYVFWLDSNGNLKQTSPNGSGGPGWHTADIAAPT